MPFFLLTGFLGAGKTTLLNRLLAAPHGRRIAVLVNDVGKINVDRGLIAARSGDLIELTGGCVCCRVDLQRDLMSGVDDLVERARPDAVVLETTGIAEPAVLLAALDEVPERRRTVVAAGVVCVVDAEVGPEGERRPEWRAQIEAADRLVLSKTDRAPLGTSLALQAHLGVDHADHTRGDDGAPAAAIAALHARLAELAPEAERAAFPPGDEATRALARYLLAPRTPARRSPTAPGPGHGQLMVITLVEDAPLAEAPLTALLESLGESLVRLKGFARIAGTSGVRWAFVERAGRSLEIADRAPPTGVTRSELVFIVEGGGIDEESLQRRLWACRAAGHA